MKKADRQSRTSKLRRIELAVWSVILVLLTLIVTVCCIHHHNSFESHSIYMPDVDGLIVGSPVCIMGIPIGHVTKTIIINDNEVRVKFRITNRSVHIPQGTIATVEFTGLGGSKSLQLYPPDWPREPNELVGNNHYILVDRPKRLRDSMALLYGMYKTLMNIIYTSTNFANELSKTSLVINMNDTSNIPEFLDYADRYMDIYSVNMRKIRAAIRKLNFAENGGGIYEKR